MNPVIESALTSHIMMVRPAMFYANDQTIESNEFQQVIQGQSVEKITQLVQREFDAFVELLQQAGVDVIVFDDTIAPETPDALFPNNWVSFHKNGQVFLYPMMAPNRQLERRPELLDALEKVFGISERVDLSYFENHHLYLEGTGSMVLDRTNKVAYACLSPRTDLSVLTAFGEKSGYTIEAFHAVNVSGKAIYHTNVMMCVGDTFAVVCKDSISAVQERERVCERLQESGREVIAISFEQMNRFAGNMLQVLSKDGAKLLVMSKNAFESLDSVQLEQLKRHNQQILTPDLSLIEMLGGGSARCMMAEIFLPVNAY